MILTDRSDVAAGDFDIQYNYDSILWESGTASGAPSGGLGSPTYALMALGLGFVAWAARRRPQA